MKLISVTIWNDYGRGGTKRFLRARYPKKEYSIKSKREYKKYTTYYLKQKTTTKK